MDIHVAVVAWFTLQVVLQVTLLLGLHLCDSFNKVLVIHGGRITAHSQHALRKRKKSEK